MTDNQDSRNLLPQKPAKLWHLLNSRHKHKSTHEYVEMSPFFIEKLFAIGTNKSLEKKNRVFFIVVLRFLVSILQGNVRQISGGLGWTPIEERVKERSRVDVVSCCVFWGGSTGLSWFRRYIEDWELMWSAAVSFEVDKQDFPVSEDLLPRRRQDTDEVSLICWGVLQYAILLRRIICMNTGWVNPWLKLWWEGWRHRAHVQLQGTFRDVKWPESRVQGFGL